LPLSGAAFLCLCAHAPHRDRRTPGLPLSAYQPLAPEGFDPNDPLVNPPDAGINGWFNRVAGLFRRSWKSMVVIFTITYVIPSIVLAIIFTGGTFFLIAGIVNGLPNRDGAPLKSDVDINGIAIGIPVLIAVVLVVIVLAILTEMAGYAAATYAVTRQATGQRVGSARRSATGSGVVSA
jgi:hypothetical protein